MRFSRLNALRTFEVAARLKGFASAAEELNVTPAAVSHQIKALEADLNTLLFDRLPRGIKLTSSGEELLSAVVQGLAHIERGIGNLNDGGMSGKLVVNVAPSIAALWLIPILGDFVRTYPEVELHITAQEEPPDLFIGEVDIRLVHGRGLFPGLNSRQFLRDTITPVCSPALITNTPINSFADLCNHTLLHDAEADDPEPSMKWSRWLNDANLELSDVKQNISFGNATLMTKAAVEGYGVALGRSALTQAYIRDGRLVRLFDTNRPAERGYYSVTTEAGANRVRVKTFRDWIHVKALEMHDDVDGQPMLQ